jgi:hypothetical protein
MNHKGRGEEACCSGDRGIEKKRQEKRLVSPAWNDVQKAFDQILMNGVIVV